MSNPSQRTTDDPPVLDYEGGLHVRPFGRGIILTGLEPNGDLDTLLWDVCSSGTDYYVKITVYPASEVGDEHA